MKCPGCQFVSSDHRDICPRCLLDLRAHKAVMGIPVSHPDLSYKELLDAATARSVRTAAQDKSEKKKSLFSLPKWLSRRATSSPSTDTPGEQPPAQKTAKPNVAPEETPATEKEMPAEDTGNLQPPEQTATDRKPVADLPDTGSFFLEHAKEEQADLEKTVSERQPLISRLLGCLDGAHEPIGTDFTPAETAEPAESDLNEISAEEPISFETTINIGVPEESETEFPCEAPHSRNESESTPEEPVETATQNAAREEEGAANENIQDTAIQAPVGQEALQPAACATETTEQKKTDPERPARELTFYSEAKAIEKLFSGGWFRKRPATAAPQQLFLPLYGPLLARASSDMTAPEETSPEGSSMLQLELCFDPPAEPERPATELTFYSEMQQIEKSFATGLLKRRPTAQQPEQLFLQLYGALLVRETTSNEPATEEAVPTVSNDQLELCFDAPAELREPEAERPDTELYFYDAIREQQQDTGLFGKLIRSTPQSPAQLFLKLYGKPLTPPIAHLASDASDLEYSPLPQFEQLALDFSAAAVADVTEAEVLYSEYAPHSTSEDATPDEMPALAAAEVPDRPAFTRTQINPAAADDCKPEPTTVPAYETVSATESSQPQQKPTEQTGGSWIREVEAETEETAPPESGTEHDPEADVHSSESQLAESDFQDLAPCSVEIEEDALPHHEDFTPVERTQLAIADIEEAAPADADFNEQSADAMPGEDSAPLEVPADDAAKISDPDRNGPAANRSVSSAEIRVESSDEHLDQADQKAANSFTSETADIVQPALPLDNEDRPESQPPVAARRSASIEEMREMLTNIADAASTVIQPMQLPETQDDTDISIPARVASDQHEPQPHTTGEQRTYSYAASEQSFAQEQVSTEIDSQEIANLFLYADAELRDNLDMFEVALVPRYDTVEKENVLLLFELAEEFLTDPDIEKRYVALETDTADKAVDVEFLQKTLEVTEKKIAAPTFSLKEGSALAPKKKPEEKAAISETVPLIQPESKQYALAVLIDLLAITAWSAILLLAYLNRMEPQIWEVLRSENELLRGDSINLLILFAGAVIVGTTSYFVLLLGCFRSTFGMDFGGLQVAHRTGHKLTAVEHVLRALIVSASWVCFGWLPVLFKRSPAHNRLTGTLLVGIE